MEGVEEATASPKDLSQIVKGKRTKRQRPQSPIPFTITTHSSSGDGGYGSNGDADCIDNNNNNNASSTSNDKILSTTTTTSKEDEDMAKCLILLAQGHHHFRREATEKIDQDQPQPQNFGMDQKFTSKRYIETPISANGKAGMYVYQCKTCGRTFPSFQALGGHRASHKKPKNMAAEERRIFLASSDDEEEPIKNNNQNNNGNRNRRISSLTLELGTRGMYSNLNTDSSKSPTPTPKVHECSYCGAEFTSGQALGGHMRRHRGATVSTTTHTTLSLSPISPGSIDQETDEPEAKRSRYGFSLDLNLPAPEADHHRDAMYAFVPKQPHQQQQGQQPKQQTKQEQEKQQPSLVLSTRRLIECEN